MINPTLKSSNLDQIAHYIEQNILLFAGEVHNVNIRNVLFACLTLRKLAQGARVSLDLKQMQSDLKAFGDKCQNY